MHKAWKLAIVLLLILGVAAAFGPKAKRASEEASQPVEQAVPIPVAPPESTPAAAPTEPEKFAEETAAEEPVKSEEATIAKRDKETVAAQRPAAQPLPAKDEVAKPQPEPAQLPKLLDLGADKCIPCKMMAPLLEELKKEYAGKLEVVFIDVWQNRNAAEEYRIRSIPTQIFYGPDGKELTRHIGFISKEDILATFEQHGIQLRK